MRNYASWSIRSQESSGSSQSSDRVTVYVCCVLPENAVHEVRADQVAGVEASAIWDPSRSLQTSQSVKPCLYQSIYLGSRVFATSIIQSHRRSKKSSVSTARWQPFQGHECRPRASMWSASRSKTRPLVDVSFSSILNILLSTYRPQIRDNSSSTGSCKL